MGTTFFFCDNPRVWQTDGRTDGQNTLAVPCVALHYMLSHEKNLKNSVQLLSVGYILKTSVTLAFNNSKCFG